MNYNLLKKICITVFLVVLSFFCVCLVGCGTNSSDATQIAPPTQNDGSASNDKKGIESGFSCEEEYVNAFCAYKSENELFPLNDVTLTFYYVSDFTFITKNISPFVELYFSDENMENLFFIRRTENEYSDENYGCTVKSSTVQFKHSEEITIPKELFTKETGKINFFVYDPLYSIDFSPTEAGMTLSDIIIYYKLDGDSVILSDTEF